MGLLCWKCREKETIVSPITQIFPTCWYTMVICHNQKEIQESEIDSTLDFQNCSPAHWKFLRNIANKNNIGLTCEEIEQWFSLLAQSHNQSCCPYG